MVISGTPIDLERVFRVHGLEPNKPIIRVTYELVEVSKRTLKDVVEEFIERYMQ